MALSFGSLMNMLAREAKLFHAFTKWDVSASIVPGCIFALPALKALYQQTGSVQSLLSGVFSLLTWNILYIYFFDISSQLFAVEEDLVNKPDRPLCTGQVTLREAKIRWVVLLVLFLGTILFHPRLLLPTLIWLGTTVLLCYTPFGKHWAVKNTTAMTTGGWALLAGSWQTVLPLTPTVQAQSICVAVWAGMTSQIQDLRDVEGDKKVNRKTLPLAFGDAYSRSLITFVFIPLGFLCLWKGGITDVTPVPLLLIHLLLGYRVLKASGKHDAKYDHYTYMILVYTFSYILASISVTNMQLWQTK